MSTTNENLTDEQNNLMELHEKAFQAIQELMAEVEKTDLRYPNFLTFFALRDGWVSKNEVEYSQLTFKNNS